LINQNIDIKPDHLNGESVISFFLFYISVFSVTSVAEVPFLE
jgi:hypothetical protein